MQIHDQPTLKAEARNLNFYYGEKQALSNINMPIYDKKVTALIGPSGCGKSTYLRSFNRMHDLYPGNRYEGEIRFFPDNTNLLAPEVDPIEVRMRIGMVFQKPNPFPKTIFENVAYGLRVRGENNKRATMPVCCCAARSARTSSAVRSSASRARSRRTRSSRLRCTCCRRKRAVVIRRSSAATVRSFTSVRRT